MKMKISTGIILAACFIGAVHAKAQTTNLTQQILQMQTFREGLILTGNQQPTDAENKELSEVLKHLDEEWWTAGVEQFLRDYPNSPWAVSLRHDYACFCRRTGRTTQALAQWEAAWTLAKSDASPQGQKLAGTVLADWMDLLSSLGRVEKLKELVAIGDQWHFVNAQDRDKFQGAKNSFYLMQEHPGIAYRCGTFALKAVGLRLQPENRGLENLPEVASPTNGFSMASLVDMAKQYGLNMVAVRRSQGQDLIVPSVVHWRQNHYAAILEQQGDLYLVNDPTFGGQKWMPADVINGEASGEFLVLATSLTNGWTQLARNEIETIHGMGLPNNINDGKDKGCVPGKPCPPCTGMPVWWVSEPYVNVWMADEPISYRTSRGDPFTFRMSYKQRDSRPSPQDNLVADTGWNHSWSSYIRLNSTAPCLNTHGTGCMPSLSSCAAIVYLPNGGEADFGAGQNYDTETRLKIVQQNPNLSLKAGSDVGDNGLRLLHADGSQDIYGLGMTVPVPYGDTSEANFLLSRQIDPHGNTTWFQYDSYGGPYVLTFVVDPDGRTNILSYNTSSSLLLSVTNAYGLSAHFKYDGSGNLTNIVDAQGLSSGISYDTNGYPTKLITPYGTTQFSIVQNLVSGQGNFGGHNLIDRAVQVTDPVGATSLYLYRYDCSSDTALNMATSFSSGDVPTGTPFGTLDYGNGSSTNSLAAVCFRNSFYWGARQYPTLSTTNINNFTANDYILGRMRHWLQDGDDLDVSGYVSVERDASPDGSTEGLKTFYDYQGKVFAHRSGTNALPSVAAWRLPNSETHYQYELFDSFGNITNLISTYTQPNGSVGTRTNQFIYASNTYTYVLGTWNGSSIINSITSSYTVPDLLTQVIGADGNPIWSYGGFDTVTWTNFFYTTTQTNATTLTSLRVLPNYATNGVGQVATSAFTSGGIPVTYYDMWPGTATQTNFNFGKTVATTYTGYGKVASAKSVAGLTTTNIYNASGFLAKTIDLEIGRTNSFSYTSNGLIGAFTNALGLNVAAMWDNLLRLTSIQFPDGTYVSNSFNKLDLGGTRDRLGNWTTFGYDGARHLTSITNANNAVTVYSWCGCGSLTTIIDALTNLTTLNYDSQGNLTNLTFPDYSSLNYQYDLAHRTTGLSDGAGKSLQFGYNNQGFATTVSNAYGNLVFQTAYDIRDRETKVTDANNVTVTNAFDALDRILSQTWPDGVAEGYGYSPQGLAFYTNRDQQVTLYGRDAAGRAIAITNANQEVTKYAFDPADNTVSMIDGLNHTTSWQYNQYSWLTNKTDGLNRNAFRYAYNVNGWITNRWTPEKGNTAYTFDNVGNLKSIIYPQQTISYSYDALNRLTNMVDAVGTTAFSYTPAGRLQSENGPWANDTLAYTYSQGLRTALSLSQTSSNWSQTYGYDSAWRMSSITSPAGGFIYSYNFQPASALVSQIALPNGAIITNAYDSLARLTQTALNNHWGHPLDAYSYTPDALGLRTNIVRNIGLTSSSVSAGFDDIGQLTSWNAAETNGTPRQNEQLGFTYDAAHNLHSRTSGALAQTFNTDAANQLTSITRTGTLTLSGATPAPASSLTVNGQSAQTYGDFTFARTNIALSNGNNTFTNIAQNVYSVKVTNVFTLNLPTSVSLSYDNNGNLTNDGTRTFGFDGENQLTNVMVSGQWRSDFVYDGLNRRRIARDFAWQSGAWVKTNEVRYIYDGLLLIQERDTNNNALVTYTRGLDLGGNFERVGGIGGLLARTDGNGSTFYHADAVGNITSLMDGSENIVARYLYNPYGKLVGKWGTLADANTIRFSSKPIYRDLYDFGYRWQVPDLDRWLNEDPIQEWGGLNLFSYAANMPVNQIDPFGLMPPGVAPAPPATWGGPYLNSPTTLGGGAAAAAEVSGAAIAGVATAAIATAGLVGYDAYQLDKIHELNKQTAEAEAHAKQKEADYNKYKKRCNEPPPTGLTPCELAKWKLDKAKDCKNLRQDFADKYYNGNHDDGHQRQIDDLNRTINRLQDWIDKNCDKATK